MRKRLCKCFPSVYSHHPDHAPGPQPLHMLVYVHTEDLAALCMGCMVGSRVFLVCTRAQFEMMLAAVKKGAFVLPLKHLDKAIHALD